MIASKIPLRKRIALDLYRIKKSVDTRLHELSYLFWECTLRCNLSCIHCGSDCLRDASLKDMPLTDFLRVVDSIKNHVNPQKTIIAITGGEPLMRSDLETCGNELYKRGFPWGMVTNGYGLTRDRYEKLLDAGLRSLTISLDGLRASHDWFRGMAGSYDRALRAIELAARTENIIFDVVSCAHPRNFTELAKIREILVGSGVKRWRLFTVFPKGRAVGNAELRLSDSQFVELMDFIAGTRRQGAIRANYGCEGFLGKFEGVARDNFFMCAAGISVGSVLVDGSISACPSLRADYIQGSIYRDDFWDVWNNRFRIMRDRTWTKTGKCASCKVYKWCLGNGLHLRDEKTGELSVCHFEKLAS
ncbi:MAG: TIGR04133 family radical SAM/SPASM protein [Chitinivibrionales bacterium]